MAEGPIVGTFVRGGPDSLVLSTPEGGEQAVATSARTLFVQERAIDKRDLVAGDTVLLISDPGGALRILNVLSQGRKEQEGGGFPSLPPRPEQGRGGASAGPAIGAIQQLEPLTITYPSGATTIVNITAATKLSRETPIDPSRIAAGVRVRVIAPANPGGSGREAFKVIVLSGDQDPFSREMKGPEQRSEGLSVPRREGSALPFLDSPFGFLQAPPQPAYLFDLDVHWVATGIKLAAWEDIETQKGVYDFTSSDKNISYLYNNGVNTIIELRANNPLYGTPSGKRSVLGVAYPEEHLAEWARFVEKLAERYDGDGIDDAPGSPIIRNYQLIHELLIPGHEKKDYWREHPDKYARFYKVTYDALKKTCPECTLYLIGGFEEDFLSRGEQTAKKQTMREDGFFFNVFRELQKQGALLKKAGFDYHYWSFWLFRPEEGPESYRRHQDIVRHIKRLAISFGYADDRVSIISREAGVNGFLDTEREQATYVIKIYASSLAAGQKHLFWTSIVEYPREAGLYLGMGLVHNPIHHGYSHKKLSYYTYKLMVQKLKDTDWGRIETCVDGIGNVYVYKFPRKNGGPPVYVVWWDSFRETAPPRKRSTCDSAENILRLRSPGQFPMRRTAWS